MTQHASRQSCCAHKTDPRIAQQVMLLNFPLNQLCAYSVVSFTSHLKILFQVEVGALDYLRTSEFQDSSMYRVFENRI